MESRFKDKILLCVDCTEEFVFTISAQEYFAQKGFNEDPKRCKSCYLDLKRTKRRNENEPFIHESQSAAVSETSEGLPGDDLADGEISGNHAN
jgi:hypothetical protein